MTEFLLALDGNFDQGSCLSHVGTEGVVMEAELRRRVECNIVSFAELPGRPPIEVVRAASRALEAA